MVSRRRVIRSVPLASGMLAGLSVGSRTWAAPAALFELDGLGQVALLKSGDVSARELALAAIERVERLNPVVNAVLATNFERALERADRIDAEGQRRLFEGLPSLIKDLTATEGMPTQMGSRLLRGNMEAKDHEFVDALEAAGVVVLGKTTTPEFGLIGTTEPLLSGMTRNPWSLDHSPGGSSGGAGAAVASGMVPVASGSDGGGSIRIPASQCGVFGLKTTMGLPVGSADSLPDGISVRGVLSRSVRDSAAMLTVYARPGRVGMVTDPLDEPLRVGLIVNDHFGLKPHDDVVSAVLATARLLESLGHKVIPASFPFDGEEMMDHFMSFWTQGPKQTRDRAIAANLDPEAVLEPWTLGLAAMGDQRGPEEIAAALEYLTGISDETALFKEFDVLLSPVLSRPPILIGEQSPILPFEPLYEDVLRYVSYTPVANVTGLPGISVPLAWNAQGLPIGSQFLARRGEDELLLRLAYQLEAAQPWADRWAPNSARFL